MYGNFCTILFRMQLRAKQGYLLRKLHAHQALAQQAGTIGRDGHHRAAKGGRLLFLQPLRPRDKFHHLLNVSGPLLHILGWFVGFALQRIWQRGGYKGRLPGGQFGSPGVEKALCSSLGTINATSHFGNVKINFQYAFLAPNHFNEECEICLKTFPYPTSAWQKEYILGSLLADCAGSPQLFPFLVGIHGIFNFHPVKSSVAEESGILTCHYGHCQIWGNILQRHPVLVCMERIVTPIFVCTYSHQRGAVYRHIFEHHNPRNRNPHKPERDVEEQPSEKTEAFWFLFHTFAKVNISSR